jgi:hypothetical protein
VKPGEDIDRAAIEAHVQHLVEQTALRKVRKSLDGLREAETRARRTLHKVLLACALLTILGIAAAWGLVYSGKDLPKEPPLKVPATLQKKP